MARGYRTLDGMKYQSYATFQIEAYWSLYFGIIFIQID